VWHGAASADVASFDVDQSVLPLSGIVNPIVAKANSTYETDNQTADAGLLYPGNGVLQGPNLLCGTFLSGSVPDAFQPFVDACTKFDYPLWVKADASQHDASTEGRLQLGKPTDPFSVQATGASAHADKDAATSDAELADVHVLGLPGINVIPLLGIQQLKLNPNVVGIANASSATDQRITDGKLVVQARSVLSGIDLVGGLIHIGSLRSTSTITDDGAKRTSAAQLEVGGVTVAGLPAEITTDGLQIGTSATPLGPVATQLSRTLTQLLGALGVKLTLLPTTHTTDDGTGQAVASAAGLLLEITLNVKGLPAIPGPLGQMDLNGAYVGTLQLGYSGASGAAATFDDSGGANGGTDLGGGEGVTDLGSGPVFGGDEGVTDLGIAPGPSTSPTAPAVTPPRGNHLVRSLGDGFDDRLGMLYLAFAFMVLALCLAPRLTLPARLPGSRS
jgi:hypothetical protein